MINPNIPAAHTPIVSEEIRSQFVDLQSQATNLSNQLASTARNPYAVQPLELEISDPPTQAEVQATLDLLNALITELRR